MMFGCCVCADWIANNVAKFNPLNAELNPICHLLALLGAHHILHISRVRAKYIKLMHTEHYRTVKKNDKVR